MFTNISPLSYSTVCCCALSSCSCFFLSFFLITAVYRPKPGWPTCCIQVGQRRGHWPAGLSLGLQWQISSCPVPGLDWSKSFHWCILLKTDIYINSMLCVYSELYKCPCFGNIHMNLQTLEKSHHSQPLVSHCEGSCFHFWAPHVKVIQRRATTSFTLIFLT